RESTQHVTKSCETLGNIFNFWTMAMSREILFRSSLSNYGGSGGEQAICVQGHLRVCRIIRLGREADGSLRSRRRRRLVCKPRAADYRIFKGAAEPSDHLSARTNRTVTRSCGSFAIVTGELGSSAAQLFVMSPGEKNITCGCQLLPRSFKYCCFDIM